MFILDISKLRRACRDAAKRGQPESAYPAVARVYAGLKSNQADPHAYNRMLSHLKTGVERLIDVHPVTGRDQGVLTWLGDQPDKQAAV